uniref:Uncharacterized protein n=1 Tax=Tanacetum cinerariifolium TaxID=118510 RepID=A0A6L2LU97_TANCI|nr:hypothetical protein [Tanacetum cinerariifolium]
MDFEKSDNKEKSPENRTEEYLVDEEQKLCLEEEERIRLEQKRIQHEKRLRLEEEKMLRLEEEKMLQIAKLYLLALSENSLLVKDMMVKLFEIDNERDLRTVADTYEKCQQLHVRCHERREKMLKMQSFLHVSTSLAESYKLLEELQDFELEKYRDLVKSISETQLKVLKKLSFIDKLRRQTYEKPENHVIFEVNYDGVFNLQPLRYDHDKVLTLKLSKLILMSFSKLLDMLSYKLEYVGRPSMYVDETIVCDGYSLPDIQKECFSNSLPLDSVGANLQVVLKKKKGRSMVKVTRKRKHQYYKKINRFRKVHGKRVSVEAGKGRLGSLVALNDHEVDDDPQLKSQV